MMGSGKSSAGALAAQHLGVPFVDIDQEIVADLGSSIPKLWADSGERAFREMETATIGRVAGTRAIVSTGGGAVLDPSNRYRMRTTGTVVWLRARPEVLAARLAEGGEGRPMLDHDFTFDEGQLTFTLKLRRRVIEQRYKDIINGLYADAEEPRPVTQ